MKKLFATACFVLCAKNIWPMDGKDFDQDQNPKILFEPCVKNNFPKPLISNKNMDDEKTSQKTLIELLNVIKKEKSSFLYEKQALLIIKEKKIPKKGLEEALSLALEKEQLLSCYSALCKEIAFEILKINKELMPCALYLICRQLDPQDETLLIGELISLKNNNEELIFTDKELLDLYVEHKHFKKFIGEAISHNRIHLEKPLQVLGNYLDQEEKEFKSLKENLFATIEKRNKELFNELKRVVYTGFSWDEP
jgi:hypothetical protein